MGFFGREVNMIVLYSSSVFTIAFDPLGKEY